ncbi:hypothetical protein CS078_06050 [Pseudomonas prosekii]|uniref:Dermonecrotic toxin N-terminal domain-containing protein n=1 Tax=Pseudomonas prosekii TaxID=1148509 RepID=A0A3L8CRX5_9PSED|nr:DUF6543 domain-containing protein [Pseudomonas prosekii]RLU07927.1 hypothetical protein CS076_17260 [Pseudomonas prosekii]RLU11002.1 hypothetical protein CS078_06050 [Pseudomonas prosekii]
MPTTTLPAATGDYTNLIAQTISERFNSRPTLRSVTASLLKDDLLEKYPLLVFDPYSTRLAQPDPEGGWRITLLLDVVLSYLASGTPPALNEQFGRACYLTNDGTRHLPQDSSSHREPDMQLIAGLIRELPAIVFVGFQQALSDYWNEPVDAGVSRWQWLGDLLNGTLKTSAIRHAAIHSRHADILSELCRHPDKQQRLDAPPPVGTLQAFVIETTLNVGEVSVSLQSPDILVICGESVLLCAVTGSIESFPSVAAFGQAWGERFEQTFMADSVAWKRYEPDGNIFDTQAALLLNQQLEDLAALKLPAGQRLAQLEKRFAAITDVAALFIDDQTPEAHTSMRFQHLQSAIPQWLQTASAADRMAYRKQVLSLAGIKQKTGGRSFQTGIDDLHTFAKKTLHQQMLKDQPLAPGYDADQLELTFHVPVGDLGSGYLQPVKMTLTQLAIRNLAGRPSGRMTIRHTGGQLIQDWTTQAYVLDLVTRVDVGKHYPELIRSQLLGDTPQAQERARLFGLELSVHLPMLALEQSIKSEQGFTRQGYRYVEALMHGTQAERMVDGQQIVLRPLAFQRKAGAAPDVVSNMFIIEPHDLNADGPRILYRPMYSPALQQYSSRQQLLSAIAQSGPVQTSVLTWLTDRARPIYEHNGFDQPHIVHVHVGDEFSPPRAPKPALLAGDESAAQWFDALADGQLMAQLFKSNAQALVELADRESVSNAESRWAIILEGGWLVFNNLLLPLLRGPVMLVGWMLQLTHSLLEDLPALDSDDVNAREQAWVDVLLNLGLVLLHVAQHGEPAPALGEVRESAVALAPLRRSAQAPVISANAVTEVAPGLPSEPPGSGHTLLDFNLSAARDSSSARLLAQLQSVRVPWPSTLPEPIAIGPFAGLYRINDKWHASLAGLLFRVRIVPGFGEVFLVPPEHPDHPGIKLKSNGRGHWMLDQGLQLVGGGRHSRITAEREKRRQRIAELGLNHQQFLEQQAQVQQRVDIAEHVRVAIERDPASTGQQRTASRERYIVELQKQTEGYATLIAEMREISVLTDSPLNHEKVCHLLSNLIRNLRKRVVMADIERVATKRRYSEFSQGEEHVYKVLKAQGEAAVQRYFEFMRQTSETNETMIACYEAQEARFQELEQIPLQGPKAIELLMKDRPEGEMTALKVKAFQLIILRILSIRALNTEVAKVLEAVIEPVLIVSRSHAELQASQDYLPSDRIAVLDNLVARYKNAQSALGGIWVFNTEELQMPAFNRMRFIIDQLRVDAEQRLVEEIQQLAAQQATTAWDAASQITVAAKETNRKKPKTSPAASKKRVIKTSRGTMIGELRPREADQHGDIVDINGPMDDQILASFHEHEPDVWVEIVPVRPPSPRISAPYAQLKGDAGKALAKVDEQTRKIESYAQGGSSPLEVEEQLQREAQKLRRFAEKLLGHEDAPAASDKAAALISELRDKALALENHATRLRIRLTLAQAPTSVGARYLLQQHELTIRAIGTRIQLKTGRQDFMQEYGLYTRDNKALWYAHFHYAALTDDKTHFTTAHLKTEGQRFETYESALAKATNPSQKIQIYHGAIDLALANKYFLPLQPY